MELSEIYPELREFVAEREWEQFHSPENLAKSIAIEAGELLECFQWGQEKRSEARMELADVLTYCLLLADQYGEDPAHLVAEKLKVTAQKYPVKNFRGSRKKYDEL